MEPWLMTIFTALISVFASSGFWLYVQKRSESKDAKTELLLGLARDRIISLGLSYIHKGWMTKDELENLDGLYLPYTKAGGNGTAKKVYEDAKRLPLEPPEDTEKS